MTENTDKAPASITSMVDAFLAEQRALSGADDGMTFTRSVQAFLSAADWIGPEHMPSVVTLTKLAAQLDHDLTAALAAQFGVTFRDLRTQAPMQAEPDDPIEAALRQRTAGREARG